MDEIYTAVNSEIMHQIHQYQVHSGESHADVDRGDDESQRFKTTIAKLREIREMLEEIL